MKKFATLFLGVLCALFLCSACQNSNVEATSSETSVLQLTESTEKNASVNTDKNTESTSSTKKHVHSYDSTITKEATCTEEGICTYTCECGDSYTESVPAAGHDYISEVTVAATETSEGLCTYTCSICGDVYTESIPEIEQQQTWAYQTETTQTGSTSQTIQTAIPTDTQRLRNYIMNNNIQYVQFVTTVRTYDYVDVSYNGDNTCRAWMENGTLYVGPDRTGKVDWYSLTGDYGCFLFCSCYSLEYVDVSCLDVTNATNLSYAFSECYNIKGITGLEYWNTGNVTSMYQTFAMGNPYIHSGSCSGVVYKDGDVWVCPTHGALDNWHASGYTDNAAITDLSGVNNWDVSNVQFMSAMFYGDKNLQNIDLSNWNTGNVKSFCHMFCRCDLNDAIVKTFEHWDIHSADNIDAMFVRGQFTTFDMSNWNTSNCVNMAEVFGYCSKLTNVYFGNIDTSKCKTFELFFIGCKSLAYVDLTTFNTSGVPEGNGTEPGSGYINNDYGFSSMFQGCSSLQQVKVGPGWYVTSGMLQTDMWKNCAINYVTW